MALVEHKNAKNATNPQLNTIPRRIATFSVISQSANSPDLLFSIVNSNIYTLLTRFRRKFFDFVRRNFWNADFLILKWILLTGKSQNTSVLWFLIVWYLYESVTCECNSLKKWHILMIQVKLLCFCYNSFVLFTHWIIFMCKNCTQNSVLLHSTKRTDTKHNSIEGQAALHTAMKRIKTLWLLRQSLRHWIQCLRTNCWFARQPIAASATNMCFLWRTTNKWLFLFRFLSFPQASL